MPTVTNQIENIEFASAKEIEIKTVTPISGVHFVQPINIILGTPTEIDTVISKELRFFDQFNWLEVNLFNLHLPILQIVGFKSVDAVYKVIQGHNIVATAIHLKIPLINAFVLKDDQLSQLKSENLI